VVAVELAEFVVRTAVAGHRPRNPGGMTTSGARVLG
jgi:hypothetical protein